MHKLRLQLMPQEPLFLLQSDDIRVDKPVDKPELLCNGMDCMRNKNSCKKDNKLNKLMDSTVLENKDGMDYNKSFHKL